MCLSNVALFMKLNSKCKIKDKTKFNCHKNETISKDGFIQNKSQVDDVSETKNEDNNVNNYMKIMIDNLIIDYIYKIPPKNSNNESKMSESRFNDEFYCINLSLMNFSNQIDKIIFCMRYEEEIINFNFHKMSINDYESYIVYNHENRKYLLPFGYTKNTDLKFTKYLQKFQNKSEFVNIEFFKKSSPPNKKSTPKEKPSRSEKDTEILIKKNHITQEVLISK